MPRYNRSRLPTGAEVYRPKMLFNPRLSLIPTKMSLTVLRVGSSGFRGVSWSKSSWCAQNRTRRIFKRGFTSCDLAAAWLAKQLGIHVSQLTYAGPQKVPLQKKSHFSGVVFHQGRFHARVAGKTVATAAQEADVVKKLAKVLKKPASQLQRKSGVTAAACKKQFKVLYPIFKHYWPGDLESCVSQEKCSAFLFAKEPALRLISCQLKYLPAKVALAQTFKEFESGCRGIRTPAKRAHQLQRVLHATAKKLGGSGCSLDKWHKNLHHKTMGPGPVFTRLGVIKPSAGCAKGLALVGRRCGVEVSPGPLKQLATSAAELQHCREQVLRVVHLADALPVLPVPTTCAEWEKAYNDLKNIFFQMAAPGFFPRTPPPPPHTVHTDKTGVKYEWAVHVHVSRGGQWVQLCVCGCTFFIW